MQKLERCTPTDAPQVRGNCGSVVKQDCEVGPVLRDAITLSNNSDVDQLQHTGGPKASVYAYVLNMNGQLLMPCKPAKARHLLKEGKAEVIKRQPFTIRLLWDCEANVQPIILGVDSGYKHVGFSATSEKKELMSGDATLRTDIPKKILQRSQYRRTRRSKLWHRPPRFLNRGKEGWLAPSIQHKLDSHIRLVDQIKKMLPISRIIVEVASFDIQKIKYPDIEGKEYQQGDQMGFWNVREYVLHRDDHTCQHCKGKSKDKILQTHHIHGKKYGATNRPRELLTVCKTCHDDHHAGVDIIPAKEIKRFKPETFMTKVRWKIINSLGVEHTYGYITKTNRIKLGLPKSHINDAFVIAGGTDQERCQSFHVDQIRRNNRSIQTNRKGFKISIRRKRYGFQPNDLVKYNGEEHRVKGAHCYGSRVVLGNKKSVAVSKLELIKYGKGFSYILIPFLPKSDRFGERVSLEG